MHKERQQITHQKKNQDTHNKRIEDTRKKRNQFTRTKNIIISFALFLIMVFGILFSVNSLNAKCLQLQKFNIDLEEDVNTENWKDAENTSLEFLDTWEKDSKKISLYIHHAELDNIHMELYKLTQYVKCKNKEESLASIHAVKFYLNHIADLEKLSMENIF